MSLQHSHFDLSWQPRPWPMSFLSLLYYNFLLIVHLACNPALPNLFSREQPKCSLYNTNMIMSYCQLNFHGFSDENLKTLCHVRIRWWLRVGDLYPEKAFVQNSAHYSHDLPELVTDAWCLSLISLHLGFLWGLIKIMCEKHLAKSQAHSKCSVSVFLAIIDYKFDKYIWNYKFSSDPSLPVNPHSHHDFSRS